MKRAFPALLLALVLAPAAGAAVTRLDSQGTILLDGRKVFPIVLAKGPPADGLGEVAGAGVNFVKVGPSADWSENDIADAIAWDRAAATHGLHTWINLDSLSAAQPGGWREGLLRQVIGSLKADPSAGAIGMWKGADEPQRTGIGSSSLRFAYCLGTGRGPRAWCAGRKPADTEHLWVTVQAPRGGVRGLERYSSVTDIHGVNRYPVAIGDPDPNLNDVGLWTNFLWLVTPRRSVWTTLQVCWTWSYDATGNFTLPTREQERFMIYDAILNGARALAFYGGQNPKCWSPLDAARGWNWSFWRGVLEPLIREIGASSPLAPALVNPGSTGFPLSSDPTTQVISRRGTGGELWMIAARSGGGTEPVTISGLPAEAARAEVYAEDRSVPVTAGALTDSFHRWGVHVYRFGRTTCPADVANGLRTVGSARQLITVEAPRYRTTSAALRLWERRADGCWAKVAGPWTARVGWNGLSDRRREGDGTTPTGVYSLGPVMYGNSPDPGVRYRYRRLVCGDWWNEDPASPTYNTFQHVRCGTPPPFRVTTPGLWQSPRAYRHFAVIQFNMHPIVPGRGSGIFLHARTGNSTNGCVSLPAAPLVSTLRWLRPGKRPLIAIGTRDTFKRL